MIRVHVDAVRALLAGSGVTNVYDGHVPNPPAFPYAVLYMDSGVLDSERLTDELSYATWRMQVTSVGLTADSARVVADKTRTALLGATPAVTGRVCDRIRQITSQNVREDPSVRDEVTGRFPLFAVDLYGMTSWPAA